MSRQTVGQIRLILPRLVQDRVAANDSPIDLVQPELAAELHRVARLVALNDRRVRLEQAQQLLRRRHRVTLQHAAGRLADRLVYQRQEMGKTLRQGLGGRGPLVPEYAPDPPGPGA